MPKHLFINDLNSGDTIADIFLLASAVQGQARNGPYWRLELKDASGTISGKVWSPLSLEYSEMPVGRVLRVAGRVGSYKDKAELAVTSLESLSEEEEKALTMADFIPSSPHDPRLMLENLKALCERELVHQPWRDFLLGILSDEDIAARLLPAPAAKSMHHAYAGGLLEHTLSVSRLCLMLADHYPSLDRQLLLAGAVCHDLGKLWELTSGMTVDYTDEGRLIGHISLVLEHIRPFLEASGLEASLVLHLQHLILSHHGTLEFGSPKLPATAEAFILHYADNIDAKMQQMDAALSSVGAGPGWSAYVPTLERFLYRAESSPTSAFSAIEGTELTPREAESVDHAFDENPMADPVRTGEEESVPAPFDDLPPPWEDNGFIPQETLPDSGWQDTVQEAPWAASEIPWEDAEDSFAASAGESFEHEYVPEQETQRDDDSNMENGREDEVLPLEGVLLAEHPVASAEKSAPHTLTRETKPAPQPLSLLAHCSFVTEK